MREKTFDENFFKPLAGKFGFDGATDQRGAAAGDGDRKFFALESAKRRSLASRQA